MRDRVNLRRRLRELEQKLVAQRPMAVASVPPPAARRGRPCRPVLSPTGKRFKSVTSAAKAHKVWPGTIVYWINHPTMGWSYAD